MKYIPLFNQENSHKLSEVKNIRGLEEKKINTLEHSTRDKLSALLDFDKLSDQTHAILKAHAKSLSQRFKNAISGHHGDFGALIRAFESQNTSPNLHNTANKPRGWEELSFNTLELLKEALSLKAIGPNLSIRPQKWGSWDTRAEFNPHENRITLFAQSFPTTPSEIVAILSHELNHFLQAKCVINHYKGTQCTHPDEVRAYLYKNNFDHYISKAESLKGTGDFSRYRAQILERECSALEEDVKAYFEKLFPRKKLLF